MAISVIIPAFRAEAFIAQAVKSVLAQTMQDFELVIGSDDAQDYVEVLAHQGVSDTRIRCAYTGGVRTGSARARNCAFEASRHSIVAVLDSDDEWLPFHLERMVPLAVQYGAAVTQVDYADHDTGKPLPNRTKPFASGLLQLDEMLLACLHTYNPIVFDRRRVTHGWQEAVPLLVDAVFLAQCYNALPGVWYVSQPSYRYYRRSDSVCNAPDAAQRFLKAGTIINALLNEGIISSENPDVKRVLCAYVARNDALEIAFEKALAKGEVQDYQEFIGKNLTMLHAPLL